MSAREVYLDGAAAMPPEPEVLDFYAAQLREHYANQEAGHLLAYRTRRRLAAAEAQLAGLLTGDPENPVVWGATATDLFRMLAAVPGWDRVVTSVLEHPALTANLRDKSRCAAWPADRDGGIRPRPLDFAPAAAFFHQVQSELGRVQDLAALFAVLPANVARVVDAVQAAGKLPLFPDADVWIVSGVKFGAPGGAAAILNCRRRAAVPVAEHAEKYRSVRYACGRVPAALALTLVRAAELSCARREREFVRLTALRRRIVAAVAPWGVIPTLPETAEVSPYILNLQLPRQQSAVIVRALAERGVYAASGSACQAESRDPSPALLAIGAGREAAYRALRVSFGPAIGDSDADFFLSELETALKNY